MIVKAFVTYTSLIPLLYLSLFVEHKPTQLYFQILYEAQYMWVFFVHFLCFLYFTIYIYTHIYKVIILCSFSLRASIFLVLEFSCLCFMWWLYTDWQYQLFVHVLYLACLIRSKWLYIIPSENTECGKVSS